MTGGTTRFASVGLILGTLVLLLYAVWHLAGYQRPANDESVLCGPISLQIALNRLGAQTRREDVLLNCGNISSRGASFKQLRSAAERLGFEATLSHLTWDELAAIGTTCVLHLTSNHFVAIDPREESQSGDSQINCSVRLYDPDRGARFYSRKQLQAIWSGAALVVRQRVQPSALAFDSCWYDVGAMKSSEIAHYTLRATNYSNNNVSVSTLRRSCSCTSVQIGQSELKPGQTTEIKADINLQSKRGPYKNYIVLRAVQDATIQDVPITLAGSVINERLIANDVIHIGNLFRASEIVATTEILDPGVGNFNIVKYEELKANDQLGDGIDVNVVVTPTDVDSRASGYRMDICIQIAKTCPLGVFERELRLTTNLRGWEPLIIRIKGAVISDVVIDPPSVLFDGDELTPGTRVVRLSRPDGEFLNIVGANVTPGLPINVRSIQRDSEHSAEVILEFVGRELQDTTSRVGFVGFIIEPDESTRIPVLISARK